eukprot:746126-Prorocentrum_minimum.AAC.2
MTILRPLIALTNPAVPFVGLQSVTMSSAASLLLGASVLLVGATGMGTADSSEGVPGLPAATDAGVVGFTAPDPAAAIGLPFFLKALPVLRALVAFDASASPDASVGFVFASLPWNSTDTGPAGVLLENGKMNVAIKIINATLRKALA